MPLIIGNASMLLGKDLSFVSQGFIEIGEDGIIKRAAALGQSSFTDIIKNNSSNNDIEEIDAGGFLVTPGFINAHTHIGDSIGKDIAVDSGLYTRVHPIFGIKQSILKNTRPDHLKSFMRASVISMMKKGVTAFADFREGGKYGVQLLRDSISDLPIRCIILGRIELYFDPRKRYPNNTLNTESAVKSRVRALTKFRGLTQRELRMLSQVLQYSDGIGLSGANENTDESLLQYRELLEERKLKTKSTIIKPLLSIHPAESQSTSKLPT